MFGLCFNNKRDSRSLFLSPQGKLWPLQKTTPTVGFYEIVRVGGSVELVRLEIA